MGRFSWFGHPALKGIILLVALVLAMPVAARDSISVGTFLDGTEFMAERHFFGRHIDGFTPVPNRPQLCVRIGKNKPAVQQELGLYDVSEHRMRWTVDVDYSKDYYIATSLGVLLYSDMRTYFLNEEGDICWQKKRFRPYFADVRDSVVLGYDSKMSDLLHGVSMNNGKYQWAIGVAQKGGWREVLSFEDGHLLISADKIFKLNPRTGSHSAFDVDNRHYNNRGALLAGLGTAIGLAAAVTVGTGFFYGYSPSEDSDLYQLNSDICLDDNCFYYADRSSLFCLDYNLHIIWEKELPKKASYSFLEIREDTLFFENTGYGKRADGYYYYDTKPYRMRFDRRDGRELSKREKLKGGVQYGYCYLKEPDKPYFTPRRLSVEAMNKQRKNGVGVYRTYCSLSLSHSLIYCDKDFYIIDLAGNVLLHFTQPIIQAELVDDVFVGLTDENVIFQFDIKSLNL
jgi:hypothetical protein